MKLKERFSKFSDNLTRHEVFVLAGSLAYTTGLALSPFVVILLSLSTLLGQDVRNDIFKNFSRAVGERASGSIQMIVENADKHPQATGISGLIGFLVLLISASAIFSYLRYALDKVNEHIASDEETGVMGFLKDRFFSMGLLLGFIFLFIASMLLTTTLSMVLPAQEQFFWQAVSFVGSFLVFSVLFAALYHFVPSDRMPWKKCGIAGVTSAFFFVIGKTLIGLYLGNAGLEESYGAAGSLVVLLVWVYYSTLTLLVSYEFTTTILLGEDRKEAPTTTTTPEPQPPEKRPRPSRPRSPEIRA